MFCPVFCLEALTETYVFFRGLFVFPQDLLCAADAFAFHIQNGVSLQHKTEGCFDEQTTGGPGDGSASNSH